MHYHPWQLVDTATSDATRAIYWALRGGTWIPGQRQRLRQLAPGTWKQALADVLAVTPGWQDNGHGHPAVEIAIYPDVVWLAARSLREDSASHLQHREISAKPKSLTSAGRPAPATAPSPATQTGPAPGQRPAGGSDPIAQDSC